MFLMFNHRLAFVFNEVSVHNLGELLGMLLLKVKSEKLDLLLKEPLATQQTEGVSLHVRRADGGLCGRSGEHDAAHVLRVVVHEVLRAQPGLCGEHCQMVHDQDGLPLEILPHNKGRSPS